MKTTAEELSQRFAHRNEAPKMQTGAARILAYRDKGYSDHTIAEVTGMPLEIVRACLADAAPPVRREFDPRKLGRG